MATGVELSSDIHVHHINFDKKDDRLENLIAMSRSEHMKFHHKNGESITKDQLLLLSKKAAEEISILKNPSRKTIEDIMNKHIIEAFDKMFDISITLANEE